MRMTPEGASSMKRASQLRMSVVLLLLVGIVSGFSGTALAAAPEINPLDDTFGFTLDICRFPIEATTTITGIETLFYDNQGNILRDVLHLNVYAVWTNPRSGKSV